MSTTNHDLRTPSPTALDDRRLYDGVLTRRVMASAIDLGVLGLIVAVGFVVLTVATLGLWLVFVWLLPIVPVVAILYVALTMGGPEQATYGMRIAGVRLERTDGKPIDGAFAALHSFLFWLSITIVTPLVLLLGLFTARRQLAHDLVLGTVVVRSDLALR